MSATGVTRRVIALTNATASVTAAIADIAGIVIATVVTLMISVLKGKTARYIWDTCSLIGVFVLPSSTTNELLETLTRG